METNIVVVKNAQGWKRIVGLIIDIVLINTIVLFVLDDSPNSAYAGSITGGFLGSLLTLGPVLNFISLANDYSSHSRDVLSLLMSYYSYCFITELLFGKTLGKAILGLKLVSTKTGSKASGLQIFIRTICRMIPLDSLTFLSKNPRGLHDSISKTSVVNKNERLK